MGMGTAGGMASQSPRVQAGRVPHSGLEIQTPPAVSSRFRSRQEALPVFCSSLQLGKTLLREASRAGAYRAPMAPKRIGHLQEKADPIPNRSEVGPDGLSGLPTSRERPQRGFTGGPGAAPEALPQSLASTTLRAPSYLQSGGALTCKKPIPEGPPEEQTPQR